MDLYTLYKLLAASGEYDRVCEFLYKVQNEAADIRSGNATYDQRIGAVATLGQMIDNLHSARKNLQQQPNRSPNTESE